MPTQLSETLWNWATDIDEGTLQQARKTSRLPIIAGHVALMPDAHVGIGATVGSVIPTDGAVIPAAVGVDIGCGMVAVETDLPASQLPDDLEPFLIRVEQVVPAGVGRGHGRASRKSEAWMAKNAGRVELTPRQESKSLVQFGSLGSGNHFFEVCLDERDVVWIVLHSGSRGIGNELAQSHIRLARTKANEEALKLEDPDLAYFLQGTPEFEAYIRDMLWAQDYAMANRSAMMDDALAAFFAFVGTGTEQARINCHHNFTQLERHGERDVWLTRKGAIKADRDDWGVIPGSMGTRSYIVRGKGSELSYNSCSHGAGRRFSRTKAKKMFSAEDLASQMAGKTWLSGRAEALLDEIPSAYKDIDKVMADQADLVEVQHTLRQVLNYKGT
ncbi:MAG TPA: RtcB family protein [Frankiaceae bacterium]|jgi:tRNA-splicing ligase RtcB|nr:RtcB family protein [Frankiaceae bacterium]